MKHKKLQNIAKPKAWKEKFYKKNFLTVLIEQAWPRKKWKGTNKFIVSNKNSSNWKSRDNKMCKRLYSELLYF